MATPLSDCGNGTRSRRERSRSLKSAELMDEQAADSCSSNVTVLAIPAQFISSAWCDVSMRIREQLRGSMRRENAADQYAADATIKINVLRECFRHKGAQMAKVNPHKFQSNHLIYWRRGSESNRRTRLCRPLHDHSATPPGGIAQRTKTARRHKLRGRALALPRDSGAGKESRTPDLNLGKVALYQLSYSRAGQLQIIAQRIVVS